MSKAAFPVLPAAPVAKLDRRDRTRETWRAAHRMARCCIRERRRFSVGDGFTYHMEHARKRFGASGWAVAQYAGRLVLELRTPAHALGGGVADLHRQGLTNAVGHPTRCIRVERMSGWRMAWCADPLAAVNANRMLRGLRARQLREERAAVLAEVEAEERHELTAKGLEALVAAGMAEDRVALTGGGPLALV